MPAADGRGGGRSVNARLLDLGVRHSAYWQRLRAGQVREVGGLFRREVLPSARRAVEEAVARIEARGTTLGSDTLARLRRVEENLRTIVDAGIGAAESRLTGNLFELGDYEARWQARTLNEATPIALDFDTPSPTLIRAAVESRPFEGAVLRDWFEGVRQDTQQRVADQLRAGIIEGQTTPQIVARIVGDDAQTGALGMSAQHVETLVRTSATHIATEARALTYEENDDLVKGYMVVETLDARTCPVCGAEDGKEYPLAATQRPPFHPGCRGTTVPILKGFDELGAAGIRLPASTRASMNGQVPDSLTYEDWIRSQPAEIQDEALGPARAAEFRRGRGIAGFVGADGRPLTLAELGILERRT